MSDRHQRYDQIAPHYDSAIRPLERWFLHELRKEAMAALPGGGLVLELGAGTGQNFPLYESSTRVIATEPSIEMLRIAMSKTESCSLTLVQSYAERLPFENESFDAALATLVMCSVQSPEEVFSELRRVVRSGGTISLLEHVRPEGLLGPLFDLISLATVPLIDDHFNRRTRELAEKAGLKISNVRKVGLGIINVITCVV
jgi:ubiquinone/menaquinone biosynthesis C-methylase UbiE